MSKCLYTLFCDDIRREAGNKVSLMGVYNDDILLDKLPVTIPSLYFFQSWNLDEAGTFKVQVRFPGKKPEPREYPAETIGPGNLAIGFNNFELSEGTIEVEATFISKSGKEENTIGILEIKLSTSS